MRNLRIFAALFLAFGSLFFVSPAQPAQTGTVQVTCAKDGVQGTYQVGWDNSNQFFMGKGNIAALYCEGGFSPLRQGATYVSDTLTNESLRYYNGVIPSPAPESTASPEVSESSSVSSQSPTATESASVSQEVSESVTISPAPEATSSPEPQTESPSASEEVTQSPVTEDSSSPDISTSPPSLQWEYVVNEGSTLYAEAPTGKVFSGAVAWYVAHDSDCGIDVSTIVAAAFNGTTSSSIAADNSVFGDPCPGQYKKLTVTFVYETLAVSPTSPTVSPEPTPTPEPSPEPAPQPTQPQPVEPSPPVDPTPEPTPEPVEPEPTPTPEPEPSPTTTPEPIPTEQPEPEPSETAQPSPTPDPVPEEPEPAPTVVPEPEPSPEPKSEPLESIEEIASDTPIEDVVAVIEDIVPTSLTEEQVAVLVSIALETFETAEQGSPEYEAALDLLLVAAQADDVVLDEALAAIPLIGNVAGAAVEVFNALGNAGADMSPQVREQSEKVVIAAVIVGQVAMTATAAATSAASAAARRP